MLGPSSKLTGSQGCAAGASATRGKQTPADFQKTHQLDADDILELRKGKAQSSCSLAPSHAGQWQAQAAHTTGRTRKQLGVFLGT